MKDTSSESFYDDYHVLPSSLKEPLRQCYEHVLEVVLKSFQRVNQSIKFIRSKNSNLDRNPGMLDTFSHEIKTKIDDYMWHSRRLCDQLVFDLANVYGIHQEIKDDSGNQSKMLTSKNFKEIFEIVSNQTESLILRSGGKKNSMKFGALDEFNVKTISVYDSELPQNVTTEKYDRMNTINVRSEEDTVKNSDDGYNRSPKHSPYGVTPVRKIEHKATLEEEDYESLELIEPIKINIQDSRHFLLNEKQKDKLSQVAAPPVSSPQTPVRSTSLTPTRNIFHELNQQGVPSIANISNTSPFKEGLRGSKSSVNIVTPVTIIPAPSDRRVPTQISSFDPVPSVGLVRQPYQPQPNFGVSPLVQVPSSTFIPAPVGNSPLRSSQQVPQRTTVSVQPTRYSYNGVEIANQQKATSDFVPSLASQLTPSKSQPSLPKPPSFGVPPIPALTIAAPTQNIQVYSPREARPSSSIRYLISSLNVPNNSKLRSDRIAGYNSISILGDKICIASSYETLEADINFETGSVQNMKNRNHRERTLQICLRDGKLCRLSDMKLELFDTKTSNLVKTFDAFVDSGKHKESHR